MTGAPSSRADRAQTLALRQQRLLLRSAELRLDLGREVQRLQPPLEVADHLRSAWAWLRTHPEVPALAAVALLVLRPRRAWRWAGRLWWGWRSWQRLQRWVRAAG